MKKIFASLLLLCLLLPSAGTYVWLSFHKKQLKKEVKHKIIAGLDKEDLVYLKFSKVDAQKNLEWKHSKEFKYKGQMYDIVETKITKDSIAYWCWWDYEETKLNKKLNKVLIGVFQEDSTTQEKHRRLTSFHQQLFYQNHPVWQIALPKTTSTNSNIKYIELFYKSISIPPPITPPRLS
ncbi:hypothetical protein INR76_01960 [Marixanthomonas sp. SCSIO 43207]|uniref:hypothetical protein n=1 Tax=Marixanthomonas sp. SCSIO 43207 TaxID=2779360 RepID=UPI001CA91CE7|nr:hypothetical protein [Marixanthomonas sp. SCSIO 43207]UAB81551.1 hypothetical protein INR76_01960 [Marixanthomonas sp. SCSIO 43207]